MSRYDKEDKAKVNHGVFSDTLQYLTDEEYSVIISRIKENL